MGKIKARGGIEAAHLAVAERWNCTAETGQRSRANCEYCSIWGNDWPVCRGCPLGPGCKLFYRWCGETPEIKRQIAIEIAQIACEA